MENTKNGQMTSTSSTTKLKDNTMCIRNDWCSEYCEEILTNHWKSQVAQWAKEGNYMTENRDG